MKRDRIQMPLATRLTITYGAVILVIFLVTSTVLDRHLTRSERQDLEIRLESLTRSVSAISLPYLMSYDYVTLQQIMEDALREPDLVEIVVFDKEGTVAGCGGHRERVGQRPDDALSLRGQISEEPFSLERKTQAGEPVLVRMQPVLASGDGMRWGTLQVEVSLRPLAAAAHALRIDILLLMAFGFLLAFGVSHVLARRITRPLSQLLSGAQNMARGVWDTDLQIRTGDEIEVLAGEFREAAESLQQQRRDLIRARDDLASLNATLEEKVRERTTQLVESQEKYRLLVEASRDPLCLVQNGSFRFVNRAFLETFGITEEQVAGPAFGIANVLHPDFVTMASETLEEAERTGETIDADWVGMGRSNRNLDFEVRGHRVTFEGEPAIELLWIDLTDRKRLLRQVVQNERLRAIGEMTAMVAHNFNNLLAVVLGRTQLMLNKTEDPVLRKGLETIRSSAMKGGEIVRRIQEYEGNSFEVPFREVSVGAIVRDVASYLEKLWRMTRGHGAGPLLLDLRIQDVPPSLGSETLLADTFKHVLTNAAEAMPGGGTIIVSVRHVQGENVVRIEDSGTGMSPEVRARAFDPFFTTKGSQTRGLGLSASYGIVQRHRGKIDLRAREGGGTIVEIVLPALTQHRPGGVADPQVVVLTEEQRIARKQLQSRRERSVTRHEDDEDSRRTA